MFEQLHERQIFERRQERDIREVCELLPDDGLSVGLTVGDPAGLVAVSASANASDVDAARIAAIRMELFILKLLRLRFV